jgi:hypothetical protein
MKYKTDLVIKATGKDKKSLYILIPSFIVKLYKLSYGKKIKVICDVDKKKIILLVK